MKQFLHSKSITTLALLLAAGSAFAGGVSSVQVTPNSGPPGTKFMVTVQGTGNCPVQLFLARTSPNPTPLSLSDNWEKGSFPATKELKWFGPLEHGTYVLEAKTLAQDAPGCTLGQKALSAPFVVERVKLSLPDINITCPDGWTLYPGSKTASGAYTCVPKPNQHPVKTCAPKHAWFDTGDTIGCKQQVF